MPLNKKSKYPFLIFLLLGLFGGLLFFPVQLSDGYTCFYHRIFDNDHPVMHHAQHQKLLNMHSSGHEFMDRYIHSYAWFWWGSLALLAFTIYRLKFYKSSHSNKIQKIDSGGR